MATHARPSQSTAFIAIICLVDGGLRSAQNTYIVEFAFDLAQMLRECEASSGCLLCIES
ncbi:hypothetical protein CHELA40_12385 [Chelatococcus asaccharovorans]|nr:hypothetical protein CHELA40_12385 [Chelatococcus asaccharovorans]CAH1682821.1 hypothetical protein CHELA17_63222 [Chelatococcus asaccharovorans]